MALVTPSIPKPSKTWEAVLKSYREFRSWPSWGAVGVRAPQPTHGHRAARAFKALETILPARPNLLTEGHVKRACAEAPRKLAVLWPAIVLDRWQYTCVYCGRDARTVAKQEKRTLRMEMDHHGITRARGGADDALENIRPACRTCNVGRGGMPPDLFREELKSLARAMRD